MQVVTHSQRFAALAEKVLRLDHGQISYFGPPSSDPFRLWGREPGTSQVLPYRQISSYNAPALRDAAA